MYPTDPQDTPTVAYKADGEEILDSEKNLFITDLGGALRGDLPTTTTLEAVKESADAAQSTADEAVKLTGDQTIEDTKTFNVFPKVYFPATKEYTSDEFVRHADIETMTALTGDSWTSLTTTSGWSGTIKYRVDKWGYFELFFNLTTTLDIPGDVIGEIPEASRVDFDTQHPIIVVDAGGVSTFDEFMTIYSDGSITVSILAALASGCIYTGYARRIKLAP